jgi:hypothetical protein
VTAYHQAYNERWPTADEIEQEAYGPLTFEMRRTITEARDAAARRKLAVHQEKMANSCTCKVCMGAVVLPHGEALYTNKAIRCRCKICRTARADAEAVRRRVRENRRRLIRELLAEVAV